MSTEPASRLAVLGSHTGPCEGLLLESIRVTHADVLDFEHIETLERDGLTVVTGDFRHKPSGRRYLITVTCIPESGGEHA